MVSGGMQKPGGGTGDDGYDEDGYDESQRAEILEATGGGPSDGTILTDLAPDLGGDEEGEGLEPIEVEDSAGDGVADPEDPDEEDDDSDDDDDDDDDDDVDDLDDDDEPVEQGEEDENAD
ncbi:DNA primase [Sphingomonas sp. 28-62-11]|uniref:DNA primase n=1 Tax=Sphingomonas sp. 28-62-11 TaxID=1970432 RepID=UPI0035A946DE